MELDKVRELVQLMVDNDLSSICIRDGEDEIKLSRTHENGVAHGVVAMPPQMTMVPPLAAGAALPPQEPAGDAEASPPVENLATIDSPMVGTFYSAPNPEAPVFVKVGDRVTASTVVCIIEAMKVFNEIRAEVSGTIEKLLATNQQSIEYGQPMFSIRAD